MNEQKWRIIYIMSDIGAIVLSWLIFCYIRWELGAIQSFNAFGAFMLAPQRFLDLAILVAACLSVFYLTGYYNRCIGRSRIAEILQTIVGTTICTFGIFVFMLLDDVPDDTRHYYTLLASLELLLFTITYLTRLHHTHRITQQIRRGVLTIPSIIVGDGEAAKEIEEAMTKIKDAWGYKIVARIAIPTEELRHLIAQHKVQQLVIATDSKDEAFTLKLIDRCFPFLTEIKLYVPKDHYFYGLIKPIDLPTLPWIDITGNKLSEAEKNIKLLADRLISFVMLLLLSPALLYFAIRVKLESKGPILFSQPRVGLHGKIFQIYKFRTMTVDPHCDNHLLTQPNDPRITRLGNIMRRYRLDELPQFWNVLRGDMSLVGPRPEQPYYVEQLLQRTPKYYLLRNVRPGITSWGVVSYGYANNIDQMIERLRYDLNYYENMSLRLDLKIIIYTIRTLVMGRGM